MIFLLDIAKYLYRINTNFYVILSGEKRSKVAEKVGKLGPRADFTLNKIIMSDI